MTYYYDNNNNKITPATAQAFHSNAVSCCVILFVMNEKIQKSIYQGGLHFCLEIPLEIWIFIKFGFQGGFQEKEQKSQKRMTHVYKVPAATEFFKMLSTALGYGWSDVLAYSPCALQYVKCDYNFQVVFLCCIRVITFFSVPFFVTLLEIWKQVWRHKVNV